MAGLTVRESELVTFLKNWKNDFSPSAEDMKAGLKLGSKSGINRLVRSLHRKGVIEYEFYRKRTIKLKTQPTTEEILLEVIGKLSRPDCETARNIVYQMFINHKLRVENNSKPA